MNAKQVSKVVWGSTSPVWNQLFTLHPTKFSDIAEIKIFDKHQDYFLGMAELPLAQFYNRGFIEACLPLVNKSGMILPGQLHISGKFIPGFIYPPLPSCPVLSGRSVTHVHCEPRSSHDYKCETITYEESSIPRSTVCYEKTEAICEPTTHSTVCYETVSPHHNAPVTHSTISYNTVESRRDPITDSTVCYETIRARDEPSVALQGHQASIDEPLIPIVKTETTITHVPESNIANWEYVQ